MMLLSRTPLRVSFFGGGTDYPEYFERYPGAVVGMAINRYVYVSALKLAEFIEYRFRLSYSKLERVADVNEIEHPVVRSVMQHYDVDGPLDISIMADLPASSGLGSSSAFTVGLVNLVSAIKRQTMTRLDLAQAATHVERVLLKERVGVQDQLHTAYGGLNRFDFTANRIRIAPIQMHAVCQQHLMDSLVLIYTGRTRYASRVLEEQMKATKEKKVDQELSHLLALADQAVDVLESADPKTMLNEFALLMHEGWETKRKLSKSISLPEIDALYEKARAAGAVGGKLCGAGGGGFLLMVVPPDVRARFDDAMRDHSVIPIQMDAFGSTILTR